MNSPADASVCGGQLMRHSGTSSSKVSSGYFCCWIVAVRLSQQQHSTSMAHRAEALKAQGNEAFINGNYEQAETFYTQAILRYSYNPLLFTNRANVRLKLQKNEDAIDDCLHSIELLQKNMKAYFLLGTFQWTYVKVEHLAQLSQSTTTIANNHQAQAQLAMHRPNVALSSALTAYALCLEDPKHSSSTTPTSALVLRCKREKWNAREKERLRARNNLLGELEDLLASSKKIDLMDIDERLERKQIGKVEAEEERSETQAAALKKLNELRTIFAIADPAHVEKRVSCASQINKQ